MRLKRITALALSLTMVTGLLSGCGDKDKGGSDYNGNGATGKYVEEEVKLPTEPGDELSDLVKNEKGELEVYAVNESGENVKYVSSDAKEWKKEDASWLNQISDGYVVSLAAGADGNNYAVVADGEEKMHLLKQTGEGTAEEINIPVLNESKGDDLNAEYYTFGTGLYVMENGNIVLTGTEGATVYNPNDGEALHTFEYEKNATDAENPVSVSGNKIAIPSLDNKGFTVWDVDKQKELASTEYGADVRNGKIVLAENNEIYYLNAAGIHHMNPEGTLVETLVEGENMTMGMPNAWVWGFVKGEEDDFYALYSAGQSMELKHYYYDENAKTKQEKKLSIYSLDENDTIRQAISVFQQQHPEVEVSYKTGEADASTTRADKIRVLNTELLNKSGADVLVLDDLPVASFIEKGVLKDISNVINPLIDDGTLQKNVAECYREKGDKIYGMPVKYGVPVLMGNQEVIDALESLDTLENWLDTHEGQKIVSFSSYGSLTRFFVNMYYDELFDKDGKVNEEKLKQCISCAKRIGELDNAEIETSYIDEETGENLEDLSGFYISDWDVGDLMAVLEESQLATVEMRSVFDMMMPSTLIREKGYPLNLHKGTFVPHGVVGINSASENTELAEEFLKVLFSDEVQNCDLTDGFPINQNAAAKLKEQGRESLEAQESADGTYSITMVGDAEGDGTAHSFSLPLVSEIEDFLNKTNELKQPAQADSVLQDMIMEEAKAYYEGSQELDATIQAIKAKVDTYRSE